MPAGNAGVMVVLGAGEGAEVLTGVLGCWVLEGC